MFRTAELGHSIPKDEYHATVPGLRAELLEIQQKLLNASFPVIIVFGGVDKAGKNATVNVLNEWLDPRWVTTRAYGVPSDEMVERPEFWRYWRDLPPKGRIGMFMRSWYSPPILDRVYGKTNDSEFDEVLHRITNFERGLADDGALIIKFWLHLGKKAQKERLRELEKNSLTRWRVTQTDWDHWQMYGDFVVAAERAIMRTSTGKARWQIVEGLDKRYRSLTIASAIRDGIVKHLAEEKLHKRMTEKLRARSVRSVEAEIASGQDDGDDVGAVIIPMPKVTILSRLDMSKVLAKNDYGKQLEQAQGKLNKRFRQAKERGISTILVFEGWDAAGKGGAIRRVTSALDARDLQVIPIAAPTDEEQAQHYLWRFWRHLSRAGRLTIFDRSWYGRVLVERVESFATETEWRRGYAEINDFEEQLVQHGIVLCKFWMHVTKDEQLARFKEREQVAYKRWKLTDEDWRNREKWNAYEIAVNEMVEQSSTRDAPWTLVEGNDKRFARMKVLSTICDRLKQGLDRFDSSASSAVGKDEMQKTG